MGIIFKELSFGGINSMTYGIYITGEAVWNAPERSVTNIEIAGKNGDLTIDNGRFFNIDVTYPAGCFADNMSDFKTKIESFRNVICSKKSYQRLADEYNPDEFRLGIFKTGFDVTAVNMHQAGEFTLTFDCKPQRFLTSGEAITTLTTDGSITNPTLFPSQPLLVVTGYGDLGIGSKTLTIEGDDPTQEIHIDCEAMEAWTESGGVITPANDLVQNAGDAFPTLDSGVNAINLDSTMSQITIIPRWWRV